MIKSVFYANCVFLALFCIAFATPFLSIYSATAVTDMAGCHPASFDMAARCPEGSIATRFEPFTNWLGSILAPVLFIKLFWDVLLIWLTVTAALGWLHYWVNFRR